jgi:hypothetical protein
MANHTCRVITLSDSSFPKFLAKATKNDVDHLSIPILPQNLIIGVSHIARQDDERGPRSFPWEVKEACWRKAEKVPGRSPDRWRMDPYGNMVFKKLVACEGALCHNYDHVQPFSKVQPFALFHPRMFSPRHIPDRPRGPHSDARSPLC